MAVKLDSLSSTFLISPIITFSKGKKWVEFIFFFLYDGNRRIIIILLY